MQKRFGVFGEPLFIGTVIGLIIGCVCIFDAADITCTKIAIGVTLGSVLILIPYGGSSDGRPPANLRGGF